MSKKDKKSALKNNKGPKRPPAIQCKHCEEWFTPFGPADKYHTSKKCIGPNQNPKRR